MLKLRGAPCIFKNAGVPDEFRENSGAFGEKTIKKHYIQSTVASTLYAVPSTLYAVPSLQLIQLIPSQAALKIKNQMRKLNIKNEFFTKYPRVFRKFTWYPQGFQNSPGTSKFQTNTRGTLKYS